MKKLISWQLVLFLIAIIAIGAFLIRQVYDADIWWQVTIGEDILNTRSVPRFDRYSLAGLGRVYHDSHWLFQVLLALSHRAFGMVGVQLAGITLWALALLFAYRAISRWVEPDVASILLFFVAMASEERFISRPEIVTFLMISLFFWLLQEGRYRSWQGIAMLSFAQCLWANSHGLFVIGPFMVGCYWIFSCFEFLQGRPSELRRIGAVLLLVVVSSLVTPYGGQGFVYAYTLFTEVGASASPVLRSIGELSSTFGAGARQGLAFWFFLLILCLTLAGSVGVAIRCKGQLPWPRILLVIGLGVAAITARRNMPLFALVAGPLIAEQFYLLKREKLRLMPSYAVAAIIGMIALAILPISGYHYAMRTPTFFGFGVSPLLYPIDLPLYLKEIGFSGQILNSGNLGGFYLYHSYPKRIPIYDGRWEVYGDGVLESIQTVIGQSSVNRLQWQKFIRLNNIQGLLLQHISPEAKVLLQFLPNDPDWRLAYYDSAASFWLRSDTANAPQSSDFWRSAKIRPFISRDNWGMLDWFLMSAQAPLEVRLHYLRKVPAQWRNAEMEAAIGEMTKKLALD